MTKRDWNGEFFKAEDNCGATIRFEEVNGEIERIPTPLITIEKANAILREEIAKLETVYMSCYLFSREESGVYMPSGPEFTEFANNWRVTKKKSDTHQTKILPPKEIEK